MSKPTISTNQPIESAKKAFTSEAQQIASSLEKGVPPSNKQITGVLETTQHFLEEKQQEQESPLSEQASKVVSHLSQVLEDTKEILQQKNPDEAIQKSLLHAKAAGEAFFKKEKEEEEEEEGVRGVRGERERGGGSQELSQKARELFHISTGLAKDVVSSAQFRAMLVDLIEISEKFFWRAADQIQKKEQAEEKEAEEEKKEKEKSQIAFEEKISIPSSSSSYSSFPTSSSSSSSAVSFSGFSQPQFQSQIPGLMQTTAPLPSSSWLSPPQQPLFSSSFGQMPSPSEKEQKEKEEKEKEKEKEEKSGSSGLTQALKQDISQQQNPIQEGLPQTKKAAQELGEKIKLVLREEELTPKESKRLRKRLRDILLKLKENREFEESLDYLLSLFNYMRPENIKKAANCIDTQYNFTMMTKEAKKFLSRFVNSQVLNRFSENLDSLLQQFENDSQFDALFQEAGKLFHQAVQNPDLLIQDQEFLHQFDEIQKKIREKLQQFTDSGKTSLQTLNEDAKCLLRSISEDPLSKNLSTDMEILVQDFFQSDEQGKLSLNMELLSELRKLLIPLLTKHLGWIPLPCLEGSDETYDYWFDDLIFSASEIIPDQIKIQMASEGELDLKNLQPSEAFRTVIKASCFGIKTTIADLSFWFRRKTFPTTEDSGKATLEITGDGMSVELFLAVSQGKTPFKVQKINVSIDSLKLTIAETRHDFLYNVIAFLMKGAIKTKIEKEIHDALYKGASFINRKLNQIAYKTYIQAANTVQATVLPVLGIDQKSLELKQLQHQQQQQQQQQQQISKTELHKE